MAKSTSEKEKFFAHLNSLDEAGSDEDNSTQGLEEKAQKRRKIDQKLVKPTLQKAATLPTKSAGLQSKPSLTRASTDISSKTKKEIGQFDGAHAIDLAANDEIPVVFGTNSKALEVVNLELTRTSSRYGTRQPEADGRKAGSSAVVAPGLGVRTLPIVGLFEGLKFYFIPNDDIHKVRRLRIQGAIAQGAVWIRELGPSITHIIVDSEIPATAVAKFLKAEIDISTVAIVKDKWLIESLSYKHVRDTDQGRFQLQGASEVFSKRTVLDAEKVANPTTAPKPAHPVRRIGRTQAELSAHELPHKPTIVTDPAPPASRNERYQPSNQPVHKTSDELSEILQEIQNAAHLPFDHELDLAKFVSFESMPSSTFIPIPSENKGFQCMEPHTGQDENPNARTIEVLQQMAVYYERTGDNWRTLAYRKAISALRKQPALVQTAKQAQSIKGVGGRLADKIEEIVTTDRLRRYESTLDNPNDQALQLFMGIYDVGYQQARLWVLQGYRTLADLRRSAKLTSNQRVGIEHYDDFQERIPREEVTKHGQVVAKALKQANPDLQGIIGGSYRRGNKHSGDIDMIITHPSANLQQLRTWVFDKVVPYLFEIEFLRCTLATPRSRGKQTQDSPTNEGAAADAWFSSLNDRGTKFHGASALGANTPWRRIDLLLTPHMEVGAALIYFTGNDIFNRSLRLLASRKGMRLNQHGLYKDVLRTRDRTKITEGELVEGRSERRIFEILGVPWREPWERKC